MRSFLALPLLLAIACGGGKDAAPGGSSSTGGSPGDGDGDGGATGGTGATGGSLGSGGGFSTGGSGGPTGVVEPDPDEPCVEDPSADRWTSSDFSESFSGTMTAMGGDLIVVALMNMGTIELRLGRVADGSVAWIEQQSLPDGMNQVMTFAVAPDGSAAFALVEIGSLPKLYYSTGGQFVEAPELPLTVRQRGSTLTALSGARLVISRASPDGQQAEQFDPENGFTTGDTTESYLSGLYRSSGDTLVSYGSPSLITEPHGRVEYTWDSGFGAIEALPATVDLTSGWTQGFGEFPNGIGYRMIELRDPPQSAGLYVNVRSEGSWSEATKLFSPSLPAIESKFFFAGDDLLLSDEEGDDFDVRTWTGGSWSAPVTLPRSRDAYHRGAAGSLNGTALIAAYQHFPADDIESVKLFRRSSDGQWYCPRLVAPYSSAEVFGDNNGNFVVVQSAYDTPLHFEVFQGE